VTVSYVCTQPFKAIAAISGREKIFQPGDKFLRQLNEGKMDETLTLEYEGSYFIAERTVVDACSRSENEVPPYR